MTSTGEQKRKEQDKKRGERGGGTNGRKGKEKEEN